MTNQLNFDRDYIEATSEAVRGGGTCRSCKKKGSFQNFITVLYDGGVLYMLCLQCAEAGNQILIRRGSGGVEILQRSGGPAVALGRINGVGALTRRDP